MPRTFQYQQFVEPILPNTTVATPGGIEAIVVRNADPVRPVRRQTPATTIYPFAISVLERITSDKWTGNAPDVHRFTRRLTRGDTAAPPPFAPFEEFVTSDKWTGNVPDVHRFTKRIIRGDTAQSLLLGDVERITPDKWHPRLPDPPRPVKRQQEPINLETRWVVPPYIIFSQHPDPVRMQARRLTPEPALAYGFMRTLDSSPQLPLYQIQNPPRFIRRLTSEPDTLYHALPVDSAPSPPYIQWPDPPRFARRLTPEPAYVQVNRLVDGSHPPPFVQWPDPPRFTRRLTPAEIVHSWLIRNPEKTTAFMPLSIPTRALRRLVPEPNERRFDFTGPAVPGISWYVPFAPQPRFTRLPLLEALDMVFVQGVIPFDDLIDNRSSGGAGMGASSTGGGGYGRTSTGVSTQG